MPEENTNRPPQASADRERSGDRRLSNCSPSSTPMTDAVWEKHSGTNAELAIEVIELCGNLERECDAVAKEAGRSLAKIMEERDELRDAVRAYRDAKGRYHAQLACERLVALLPENVKSAATGSERKDHE